MNNIVRHMMELDEILTVLGYKNINDDYRQNTDNTSYDKSNVEDNTEDNDLNKDIPGGFRELNPLLFITIGEVIGDIISGNLPFNTANSISNFLTLVGQIIETYGAQQQYFESGPGNFFDKNMHNAFYGNTADTNNSVKRDYSTCDNNNETSESEEEEISISKIAIKVEKMQKDIDSISRQINLINNDIREIKNHFK